MSQNDRTAGWHWPIVTYCQVKHDQCWLAKNSNTLYFPEKKQSEIYDDNMPHSHLERQSTVTTNHFFTKELHSVLQYIWNTCTFNTWVTFSSFILLFLVFQHIIILLEQKQMRICERFIKHRWSGCVVCIKRISLGKHYNKTDNYTVKSLCQQYLKLSNITYLLLIMTYS